MEMRLLYVLKSSLCEAANYILAKELKLFKLSYSTSYWNAPFVCTKVIFVKLLTIFWQNNENSSSLVTLLHSPSRTVGMRLLYVLKFSL